MKLQMTTTEPYSWRTYRHHKPWTDVVGACSYMESFNAGTAGGDQLVLPSNVLERWFTRFEDRFRRDPDFLVRRGQVA